MLNRLPAADNLALAIWKSARYRSGRIALMMDKHMSQLRRSGEKMAALIPVL